MKEALARHLQDNSLTLRIIAGYVILSFLHSQIAVIVTVSPYSCSTALSVTVRFSAEKPRPMRVMRFCERAKGAA